MIRLFATDLDGTLLVDGKIPRENLEALKRLQERGVAVCLVSGRASSSIRWVADEAGLSCYVISTNGSLVEDPEGNILEARSISRPDLRRLIDLAEEYGVYFHFYDRDTFYTRRLDASRYEHLKISVDDNNAALYQCALNIDPRIERLAEHDAYKFQYTVKGAWDTELEERLREIPGVAVTRSAPCLVEAMEASVDKWEALERLAAGLGIRAEEICACGDFRNDRRMIRGSGFGVAMGNAEDAVLEVADFVTKRFDEFGIAHAIGELERRGLV